MAILIDSFSNILFTWAYDEERMAVKGDGRPLHACEIIVHSTH